MEVSRYSSRKLQSFFLSRTAMDLQQFASDFASLCAGIAHFKRLFCIYGLVSKKLTHIHGVKNVQLMRSILLIWKVRQKLYLSKRVEELYQQVLKNISMYTYHLAYSFLLFFWFFEGHYAFPFI